MTFTKRKIVRRSSWGPIQSKHKRSASGGAIGAPYVSHEHRVEEFPIFRSRRCGVSKGSGDLRRGEQRRERSAIDAIRLLILPLGGRREIYFKATDIRFQSAARRFDLQALCTGLSTAQQGRFISAVTDASMTEARFGRVFDGNKPIARPTLAAPIFNAASAASPFTNRERVTTSHGRPRPT